MRFSYTCFFFVLNAAHMYANHISFCFWLLINYYSSVQADNLFDAIHGNRSLIQDSIVEKADKVSSGENDK